MTDERRKLISYKGKAIICHDYTNLEGDEYTRAIEKNAAQANELDMEERLVLIDVTNSVVDKQVLKAFKRISKHESSRVSKTAIVGVTGIQKMFVDIVVAFSKLEIKTFDNHDDAKEWLLQ